jgi:hypothetical protein
MNRLQKMAWYQLIVIAAVLALTGIVVAVLAWRYGMSQARGGLGTLGLLGLLGFSRHLFRKKTGEVDLDERDLLIQKRALATAYTVFWVAWVLGSMIAWGIIGPENSVSVNILPLTVGIGGIIVVSVQSIAILVQYGWGTKGDQL